VLRGQEARLASLARQGFTVADVVRAYQLFYSFTIGFCIEEQAVAQAGDDRYSLSRRAERVGATTRPLAAEAGPAIFGDPDTRFAELVAILVDAAGRLRAPAGKPQDASVGRGAPGPSGKTTSRCPRRRRSRCTGSRRSPRASHDPRCLPVTRSTAA
jgi:Tetracyclin repressor-like, C-terminal domain